MSFLPFYCFSSQIGGGKRRWRCSEEGRGGDKGSLFRLLSFSLLSLHQPPFLLLIHTRTHTRIHQQTDPYSSPITSTSSPLLSSPSTSPSLSSSTPERIPKSTNNDQNSSPTTSTSSPLSSSTPKPIPESTNKPDPNSSPTTSTTSPLLSPHPHPNPYPNPPTNPTRIPHPPPPPFLLSSPLHQPSLLLLIHTRTHTRIHPLLHTHSGGNLFVVEELRQGRALSARDDGCGGGEWRGLRGQIEEENSKRTKKTFQCSVRFGCESNVCMDRTRKNSRKNEEL